MAVLLLSMMLAGRAVADERDDTGQWRVGLSGVLMATDGYWGSGSAVGGSPTFDFQPGRHFFIGFQPQVSALPATSTYGGKSIVVLDTLARLGWTFPLNERGQVYGYLAPGRSWLFYDRKTVAMPSVGAHLGAALALGRGAHVTVGVGRQVGWNNGIGDSTVFLKRTVMTLGAVLQL